MRIPTPLRSYTGQQSVVEGRGTTVDEVLADLDRQFPGFRFRVVDEQGRLRTHMKVWVGEEPVDRGALATTPVGADDEVTLMQALSGG
ncbi:MAG TPA: MoaD/ThiS family protein [Acidimicrobiales bacterium]|nr:MoaD/ThiS family protein [Acidimicrobiales bacterium]